MKSLCDEMIAYLWSCINERNSIIKNVPPNCSEVKDSSLWIEFQDGSGSLRQYVKQEGVDIPIINLFFATRWQKNFICVFDKSDKCLFAACASSEWTSKINDLLRNISRHLQKLEEGGEVDMWK